MCRGVRNSLYAESEGIEAKHSLARSPAIAIILSSAASCMIIRITCIISIIVTDLILIMHASACYNHEKHGPFLFILLPDHCFTSVQHKSVHIVVYSKDHCSIISDKFLQCTEKKQ